MKKVSILIAAAIAMVPVAQARGTWTLQGTEYTVDTLQHYKAGPGTTITVMNVEGPVKHKVWVSETDLKDPNVDIKTYNPSLIRSTNTTVSNMVANRKGDGNVYCVGVNADLFSSNGPIGTTVMAGEILKTAKASTAWEAIGYEEGEGLYLGTPSIMFSATINGSRTYAPTLVNVPRAAGETIIYTRRWGTTTGTTKGETGLEVLLRPEGGVLNSMGETKCTVVAAPVKDGGSMAISEGCIVLSTNISSHITNYSKLKAGDTFTITTNSVGIKTGTYSGHGFTKIREMIGGDPQLMADGQVLTSLSSMPNADARRPRTAIGTDQTHSIMKILVIDGDSYNKGISAGVNAKDLADMMKAIGCYDALNFDGGGSSEMWNNHFGTLNRPSDGGSRKVRNGWFITTPDKGDTSMSAIEFACGPQTLEIGDTFTPKFYGYNKAGVLVKADLTGVRMAAPSGLGTISADGKTLTVTGNGTYRLEAEYNGMRCYLGIRAGDYMANQTGIDEIVVDNTDAPVEYYTLQGVRVENPANGVFIRRQGTNVSKILL